MLTAFGMSHACGYVKPVGGGFELYLHDRPSSPVVYTGLSNGKIETTSVFPTESEAMDWLNDYASRQSSDRPLDELALRRKRA